MKRRHRCVLGSTLLKVSDFTSVVDPDPYVFGRTKWLSWMTIGYPPPGHIIGSGSVADPDPGSGAFLTPGSEIRDPGWVESSNSLMRIRDPGWRQFGSGIRDEKKSGSGINIPDPQHWVLEPGQCTLWCAGTMWLGWMSRFPTTWVMP
jgi:hypothetical protein